MGRKRKESALEHLLAQFWDMTGYFWQIGAVITALFGFVAAASAVWVLNFEQSFTDSPVNQIFKNLSWLFYSIPIIFLGLSIRFGRWTYLSYLKQNGMR